MFILPYGLKFWGSANKPNINKIQVFQNITLRKVTNAPIFVFNLTLHQHLGIQLVIAEAELFYKLFFAKLENCTKSLIKE